MTPTPARFKVVMAGFAEQHLRRLVRTAEDRDLGTLLETVIVEMIESLETEPRSWGDPNYDYPAMNAVGYGKTINHARIRIGYAVHAIESVVWISSILPLPKSPFA